MFLILQQGRVVHFKPDFGPDADEDVEMKKIVAKDPFEPRLKPIRDDKRTAPFVFLFISPIKQPTEAKPHGYSRSTATP